MPNPELQQWLRQIWLSLHCINPLSSNQKLIEQNSKGAMSWLLTDFNTFIDSNFRINDSQYLLRQPTIEKHENANICFIKFTRWNIFLFNFVMISAYELGEINVEEKNDR